MKVKKIVKKNQDDGLVIVEMNEKKDKQEL